MLRMMAAYNNDHLSENERFLIVPGLRTFVGKDPKIGYYDYADLEERILRDINRLESERANLNEYLLEIRKFIEKFEQHLENLKKQNRYKKEDEKILYAARAAFFALAQKLGYDIKTALQNTGGYTPRDPQPFGLFTLGTLEYSHPNARDPIQHTLVKQFYECCTSPKGLVDGPTDLKMGRDSTKRSYEALDAYRKALMKNPEVDCAVALGFSRGGADVNNRFFQRLADSQNSLLPSRVQFSEVLDPVAGWGRKSAVREVPANVEYTLALVALHEGRWTHSEQSTATGRGYFSGLRRLFQRFTTDHHAHEPFQSGEIMPFSGEHNNFSHSFASKGASSYINATSIIVTSLTFDVLTENGLTFSRIPLVVDRKTGDKIRDLQEFEDKGERYLQILGQYEIIRESEEKFQKHARGEALIYSQRTVAKIKDEFVDHPKVFLNQYHEYAFSRQYPLLHNYLFNGGTANPFSHDPRVKLGFNNGYLLKHVHAELDTLFTQNKNLHQQLIKGKYLLKTRETTTLNVKLNPDRRKARLVPHTTTMTRELGFLPLLPPKKSSTKVHNLLLQKPVTGFDKYIAFAKDELKKTWFETGRPKKYVKVKPGTLEALLKAPVVSVHDVFSWMNSTDKQNRDEKEKDSEITRGLVQIAKTHSDLNHKLRESMFEILFIRLAQHSDPFIKDAAKMLRELWTKYDRHHKKSETFVLYLAEQLFNQWLEPSDIRKEIIRMQKGCYFWQGDSKKRFAELRENLDFHYPLSHYPHRQAHVLFKPVPAEDKSKVSSGEIPSVTAGHRPEKKR